jgi:hypothetical protein
MRWPAVASLIGSLAAILLGLGLGAHWTEGSQTVVAASSTTTTLAWLTAAVSVALVYGRSRGLLAWSALEPLSSDVPRRTAISLLRSVDVVLRLIEGETALTWTTVIGVAILAIALRT